MSEDRDTLPSEQPAIERIFTATLWPYRSLSRRGFNILMAVAGVVSFTFGVVFVSLGAWPVFGFFGLDVLIIFLAFRRNYLDARAFEHIDLTREVLTVRRVTASGRERLYTFHPYWTRLVVDRKDWGIAGLSLTTRGFELKIASFLSPGERESFAAAFSKALSTAREAPAG
jgi:uncharacterized membrane protein